MLAEIFLLRLETLVREAAANKPAGASSNPRFVPIAPPRS
jgi:hypothetical protein